jgi:hypothetical protein
LRHHTVRFAGPSNQKTATLNTNGSHVGGGRFPQQSVKLIATAQSVKASNHSGAVTAQANLFRQGEKLRNDVLASTAHNRHLLGHGWI